MFILKTCRVPLPRLGSILFLNLWAGEGDTVISAFTTLIMYHSGLQTGAPSQRCEAPSLPQFPWAGQADSASLLINSTGRVDGAGAPCPLPSDTGPLPAS